MRPVKEKLQFRVGLFFMGGLAVLMLVVFMLGGEKQWFESRYQIVCHFKSISGLRAGAPVQLAGIHIGTVEFVDFNPSLKDQSVRLTLSLTKKYQDRIRQDSLASIQTQGLLGDKMIQITVGTPEMATLKDGDEIKVAPNSAFEDLMFQGQGILEKVDRITANLDGLLSDIRQGPSFIHDFFYDPTGAETMENLQQVLQSAQGVLKSAQGVMGEVKGVVSKVNKGEGTVGALFTDPTLFYDLKTLLGKANRNKLVRAVIRETLQTKEDKALNKNAE